jgi:hypothetical protein
MHALPPLLRAFLVLLVLGSTARAGFDAGLLETRIGTLAADLGRTRLGVGLVDIEDGGTWF